ncbi:MAG: IS630 family transposase [Candidatus Entotheonellia bacterium]
MSFPPGIVVAVKALACELPSEAGLPLSRFSMAEIKREVIGRGLVASIGETTIWRWLSSDAIRPWHHRSWIFPRDPDFAAKAGRVLDLYEGIWQGEALATNDYVISSDEKTSIQARRRKHRTAAPCPGQPMRVEHEYTRKGAWAYLAAWDVRHARIFGRCEHKTGIAPFERLVRQVMSQEPYRSASRVFWVVDNGSSHRGQRCQERLSRKWSNLIVVHTPIHASWLNQVEIYFSVVQRKVLTPNHFNSLTALEDRLLNFQAHYQAVAKPFRWRFTRQDLEALLRKLDARTKAA